MTDYSLNDWTPPKRATPRPSLDDLESHRRVDSFTKPLVDSGTELQYAIDYDELNDKGFNRTIDPPTARFFPRRWIGAAETDETEEALLKRVRDLGSYRHRTDRPCKIYKRTVYYGPWIEIDEVTK